MEIRGVSPEVIVEMTYDIRVDCTSAFALNDVSEFAMAHHHRVLVHNFLFWSDLFLFPAVA